MKDRIAVAACAGLMALLLAGCGTVQQAMRCDPPELTGFLPDHRLLVRQPPSFPFHYLWQARGIDWRRYSGIYVAPVNTNYLLRDRLWKQASRDDPQSTRQDLATLGNYMRDSFVQELRKVESRGGFKVVNRPRPRTLTLELAVTWLRPTEAELNYAGTAANLLVPGVSLVTRLMATGTVSMEARLVDSRTRQLLFMVADREKDPAAVIPLPAYTWYGATEYNMGHWAQQLAAMSVSARFADIEHDAPIHLIAY